MSSRALMPSTDRLGSFSAGASRTNFIERCDPLPFESEDSDEGTGPYRRFRFSVCNHPDGMQAIFDICVHGEGETVTLSKTDWYRLYCHAMVQQLPDSAFEEVVEALNRMYEFYHESPALLIPPPPPQSVRARITGSYTAPVYPFMED